MTTSTARAVPNHSWKPTIVLTRRIDRAFPETRIMAIRYHEQDKDRYGRFPSDRRDVSHQQSPDAYGDVYQDQYGDAYQDRYRDQYADEYNDHRSNALLARTRRPRPTRQER